MALDSYYLRGKYVWLWAVLAAMVIFIASYFFLLGPAWRQIKAGGPLDVEAKKTVLEIEKRNLAEFKELKALYEQIKASESGKLTKILPGQKDVPGLFVQLETIASENGLILSSVNINPEVSIGERRSSLPANIKRLNTTVKITGGHYDAFKRFLTSVENNLRMMDITSLNFGADATSYTISLVTYYTAISL